MSDVKLYSVSIVVALWGVAIAAGVDGKAATALAVVLLVVAVYLHIQESLRKWYG